MPTPGPPASRAVGPEAGEIADGIDADREAAALFFMIQGLIGPILMGVLGPADALGLVDHRLDHIFRWSARRAAGEPEER